MTEEEKKVGNKSLMLPLQTGGILQPFCNPFGAFGSPYFPSPYPCFNNTPYQCTPILICKSGPCNTPIILPMAQPEGGLLQNLFNFQMPQAPASGPSAQTSQKPPQTFVLPSMMRPGATSTPMPKAPGQPPTLGEAAKQTNPGDVEIKVELAPPGVAPESGAPQQSSPEAQKFTSADFRSFNAGDFSMGPSESGGISHSPSRPGSPVVVPPNGVPPGLSTSLPLPFRQGRRGANRWSIHVGPNKFAPAAKPLSPLPDPNLPQAPNTSLPTKFGSPPASRRTSLPTNLSGSMRGGQPNFGGLSPIPKPDPPQAPSTSLPLPFGSPKASRRSSLPTRFSPVNEGSLYKGTPYEPPAQRRAVGGLFPGFDSTRAESGPLPESSSRASPASFRQQSPEIPGRASPYRNLSLPPVGGPSAPRRASLPARFTSGSPYQRPQQSLQGAPPVQILGASPVDASQPSERPTESPFEPVFHSSAVPPQGSPVSLIRSGGAQPGGAFQIYEDSGHRSPAAAAAAQPGGGFQIYQDSPRRSPAAAAAPQPGGGFQIFEDSPRRSPAAAAAPQAGGGFQIFEDSPRRSPVAAAAPQPGGGFQIYQDSPRRSPAAAQPGGGFQIFEDSPRRSPAAAAAPQPGAAFEIFEDSPDEDAKLENVELEVEIDPQGDPLKPGRCAVTTRVTTPSQKLLNDETLPMGDVPGIKVEINPPDEPSALADQENLVPGGARARGALALQDRSVHRQGGDRSHITVRLDESAPAANNDDSYYLSWYHGNKK